MDLSRTLPNPTAYPADWANFYADLQRQGSVPHDTGTVITAKYAVFRGMFQDLGAIEQQIRRSGFAPPLTTIYADVLVIPATSHWLLQSAGLVIFARRIEVAASARILLNFQRTATAYLLVFANEVLGCLTVVAATSGQSPPVLFPLTEADVAPGILIDHRQGQPSKQARSYAQGMSLVLTSDQQLYFANSFIFAALLYDQHPALALAIFSWIKNWAAQSPSLEDLFYRSASLVTLLSAQVNAAANGATFVPYLSSEVYTTLASAFAVEAAKYESNYQHLSTRQVFMEAEIALAQTMVANTQSEIDYAHALLQQANNNYANAVAAANKARSNFRAQRIVADKAAVDFEEMGIPAYKREQTVSTVVSLVTAVVTFGTSLASVVIGNVTTVSGAAESAVDTVTTVVQAADTTAEVAQSASNLAATMEKLKTLVETLEKVYAFAQTLKAIADSLKDATGQMQAVQAMQEATTSIDLSAVDTWAIYKVQMNNILQDPIDKKIGYAAEYKEALDILVIYGQSLSAAQLAVIEAGQQAASIGFQVYYAQQKQANLQQLVDSLQVGKAPMLALMQQLYQKYLDSKSSLFAALKSYQASYFYWALRPSAVQPRIVDSVSELNAGIRDITRLALDKANALNQFDPPPQTMKNAHVVITDPAVLQQLQTTGQATWVLPLDSQKFAGLNRIRVSTIRIWLEGAKIAAGNNSLFITITTAGNYFDQYKSTSYQFNSKPLTRTFKYMVADRGQHPDWHFDNGSLGFVQIDGAVDREVAYAYFQPTPFSEWSISLLSNNHGIDYQNVTKITMCFEGTAIGVTPETRRALLET